MRTLLQDLRYSARMLARKPGFTLIVVLTLALGIGANIAIFSVVNTVLLRPLPYKEPDRLVVVWEANIEREIDQYFVSAANFIDWELQNKVFEHIAAFRASLSYNLTGGASEPVRISVTRASVNMFPLLGIQPLLGRAFLPEEGYQGRNQFAIVSYGFWQRHFGSEPNIIGRKITLHDLTCTVVGVMPPGFQFPYQPSEQTDVWLPLALDARSLDRTNHDFQVIARLRPNVSLAQAQAAMETVARRLREQYPDTNRGWTVRLVPLREQIFGVIPLRLFLLQAAVAFVLFIACVNVASLFLARAEERQKEIAIRLALGAGRLRILRQLVTESMLLAVLSGALGLTLVLFGTDLLIAFLPSDLPNVEQIRIDSSVLGGAFAVSILTGLIFGLVPALMTSTPKLSENLKGCGRASGPTTRGRRARGALVATETALGLVLLIGATLMISSFLRLQKVYLGFNPSHLLTMSLYLPHYKYPEDHLKANFYKQLLGKVESLPDVESASLTTSLPLSGLYDWVYDFSIAGRQPLSMAERPVAHWRAVAPNYFRTMRIPLLKGRGFSAQDEAVSRQVVIVDETFERLYFQDGNPIGQLLSIAGGPPREIVGVVGSVKHQGGPSQLGPQMYVPYLQSPMNYLTLVARTTSAPSGLIPSVRSRILSVDKDQAVFNVKTMEQVVSDSISIPRFQSALLGLFAVLALLLAAVGIYGIVSYSAGRRNHEIGIRMALGAQKGDVIKLVVGQGMIPALIGVAVGLVAAFALTRVMSSLLFGVSATDPTIFIGVSFVIIAVALFACYIPARRATKVDPMVALRHG